MAPLPPKKDNGVEQPEGDDGEKEKGEALSNDEDQALSDEDEALSDNEVKDKWREETLKYECVKCRGQIVGTLNYHVHYKQVHYDSLFLCPECGANRPTTGLAKAHVKSAHDHQLGTRDCERIIECLQQQHVMHEAMKRTPPEESQRRTRRSSAAAAVNYKEHHAEDDDPKVVKFSVGAALPNLVCCMCPFSQDLVNAVSMVEHYLKAHGSVIYVCPLCPERGSYFYTPSSAKRHFKVKHDDHQERCLLGLAAQISYFRASGKSGCLRETKLDTAIASTSKAIAGSSPRQSAKSTSPIRTAVSGSEEHNVAKIDEEDLCQRAMPGELFTRHVNASNHLELLCLICLKLFYGLDELNSHYNYSHV